MTLTELDKLAAEATAFKRVEPWMACDPLLIRALIASHRALVEALDIATQLVQHGMDESDVGQGVFGGDDYDELDKCRTALDRARKLEGE